VRQSDADRFGSTCIVKALRSEGGSGNAAWAMVHDH